MAEDGIGSVSVEVVPDAENFWRRFEEQSRAKAVEAGRNAGKEWQRGFDSETHSNPVLIRVDTRDVDQQVGKIRTKLGTVGNVNIGTGASAGNLATITAATNRLADAQEKLRVARKAQEEAAKREGVTEEELAAAAKLVERAQRDEELAALRLAAAQESVAKAQDRARVSAEKQAAAQEVVSKSLDKSKQKSGGLLSALLPLAPTLVPIAGGALAAGGAFAAMGASGILAFKGVQAEIKGATPLGVQYAASLGVAKSGLQQLEKTAAGGVLTGFQAGISKANAQLPALNQNIALSSKNLGTAGAAVTGGLIAGFNAFAPLIHEVEGEATKLALKFEDWAGGPGGSKFAATLSDDFKHLVPALSSLSTLAVHFISALNPVGTGSLDLITHFSGLLEHLPVGVLTAGTAAYVAFKAAVAVTSGIDAATAALARFTAAEAGAAGAAGAGAGARVAGAAGIGRIGRYVRNAALFEIAGQSAGALSPSNTYVDRLSGNLANGNALGGFGDVLGRGAGDLANFNLGAFGSDLFGANAHAASTKASIIKNYRRAAGLFDTTGGFSAFGLNVPARAAQAGFLPANALISTKGTVTNQTYTTQGVPVNAQGVPQKQPARSGLTLADYEANLRSGYTTKFDAPTVARQNLFQSQASKQAPVQLAASYDVLNSSLQKTITSQGKWLDQGGKSIFTYKGVSVGANTYADALSKTGGNATKARALIEGQVNSLVDNKNQLTENTDAQGRLDSAVAGAATKFGLSTDMVSTYAQVLGISSTKVADGTITQNQFIAAIGEGAKAIANGSTSISEYIADLTQFQSTADTAASRGALIGATLKAANGDAISYANTMVQAAVANQQLVTDFKDVKKGVVDWKTGVIDFHNAAAAPLLSDLAGLQQGAVNAAAAVYQHETALGNANAAADAFTTYTNDTSGALETELEHMGKTKAEAKRLADEYFNIKNSGDLKKQIELIGGDHAAETTSAILEDLDALTNHNHSDLYFVTHTEVDPNLARILNLNQQHRNTFGGALTQATGGLVEYYANGGTRESHFAQIAPTGTTRIWNEPETGGEGYVPLAASKRSRSRMITKEIAKRLGGAAFFESGGFSGVDYSGSGKSGSGSSNLDAVKAAISALTAALNQPAAQLSAAASALLKAGDTAGLNSKQIATLTADQKAMVTDAYKRDAIIAKLGTAASAPTAYERLATAQQAYSGEQSSVSSAFGGLLNIGSLGLTGYTDQPGASASSILSGLTGTANQAGTLSRALATLKAKGLNAALLGQLASNPSTDSQQIIALAGASSSQISAINGQFGRLNTYASAAGTTAASSLYGAGVSAAQGLVNGLKAQEGTLAKEISNYVKIIESGVKTGLGIHSPSKVGHEIGDYFGQGVINGLVGQHEPVRNAAAGIATAVASGGRVGDPGPFGNRRPAQGDDGRHYHVHGIDDPYTFLALVNQQEWMRAAI